MTTFIAMEANAWITIFHEANAKIKLEGILELNVALLGNETHWH
jgi:hypothetical protein